MLASFVRKCVSTHTGVIKTAWRGNMSYGGMPTRLYEIKQRLRTIQSKLDSPSKYIRANSLAAVANKKRLLKEYDELHMEKELLYTEFKNMNCIHGYFSITKDYTDHTYK